MAIRNLLHHTQLEAFKTWVQHQGYIIHPTPKNAVYEVLRIEEYTREGNNPHIVFYRRTHDGTGQYKKNYGQGATHITIPNDAEFLVRRFLRETKVNGL